MPAAETEIMLSGGGGEGNAGTATPAARVWIAMWSGLYQEHWKP